MMRRGMTLIEMLVVITIIAVLIGLLLPLSAMIRDRARWLDAANRVELARRALTAVAPEDGHAALTLIRATAMPGVIRASYQKNSPTPSLRGILAAVEGDFLPYDQPWQLRFPLGESSIGFWATLNDPRFLGPAAGQWAYNLPGNVWDYVHAANRDPIPFALSDMTTLYSGALLVAAGVVPDVTRYRGNRDAGKPWNDPWGHPLIVGSALFQYGPANAATLNRWPWTESFGANQKRGERNLGTPAFSEQWRYVREQYGTSQRLYLAVGAVGPEGPSALTTPYTDAQIAACWQQILTLCNTADDGSALWRIAPTATPPVDALANPPWQGLRQRKVGSKQSLLALPLVIE